MISEVNIGYDIPNIKKIVNAVSGILSINSTINIVPMKIKLNEYAYAIHQNGQSVIYVSDKILEKDKINAFNIKLFIHEMWHLKQMIKGELIVGNNKFTWKGQEYSSNDNDRPWESEARQAEYVYYKQIKDLLI